ncbi:MAG TPA: GAF domain-containing protein [Cyclobacteriaceae bacterium]|nr:GAF domain-containing protein [Cyclobacteriaceae bacterium]
MDDYTQFTKVPYRSYFSLKGLVEFWEEKLRNGPKVAWATQLLDRISNSPLKQPLGEEGIPAGYEELVEFMMGAVFPYSLGKADLAAAVVPFAAKPFYTTPAFNDLLAGRNLDTDICINVPGGQYAVAATLQASLQILRKFYKADFDFDRPMLVTLADRKSGLERVYKIQVDNRFCDIVAIREPEPIDPHVLKFLTEKIYDLDLILQYIRPDNFEFHGFLIMRLTDVTLEEMLSSIKYELIAKDSIGNTETFKSIQQKLRSIMEQPDLRVGLAYFDPNNNLVLNTSTSDCWKSVAGHTPAGCDYAGSVYERSWVEKRSIAIDDVAEYPYRSKAEDALLESGVRSLMLSPLVDGDETIGLLELASPQPGMLTAASATKLENALPMFTVAVKRAKADMETGIRALIQEECTAIHPSVQWRFFEAGLRLLNQRRTDPTARLEEIVFRKVYPFFGMIDIRNSSRERNAAIQLDLQENLRMAVNVLERLSGKVSLPLLDELIFRAEKHMALTKGSLSSGDEIRILEFLKGEIHPVLQHFSEDETLGKWIQEYKSQLDPKFDVVYKRRGAFEDSLNKINSFVAGIIDQAEDSAQRMFPHYFEKYKTDGVEFTLYLGDALVQDRKFNEFYLRNFRLWQLILMCSVEQQMALIRPELKTRLDITQLILVHDQPVTIRFRPDEKRFDVDGAYDIRYEIIKKRIDKAKIKDDKDDMQRLTQPGKIAIVYSQPRMAQEYKEYFSHLRSKDLITGEIEDFELEELPGAIGLRALRITVSQPAATRSIPSEKDLLKDIEQVIRIN